MIDVEAHAACTLSDGKRSVATVFGICLMMALSKATRFCLFLEERMGIDIFLSILQVSL